MIYIVKMIEHLDVDPKFKEYAKSMLSKEPEEYISQLYEIIFGFFNDINYRVNCLLMNDLIILRDLFSNVGFYTNLKRSGAFLSGINEKSVLIF